MGASPRTASVAVACPVTLPGVFDVKVIVHWPFAFVFGPAFPQVPVAAVCAAPFESVSVKSTCSPAAGLNTPAPAVSFKSVTVNVCGWPISFVASGSTRRGYCSRIFAATNRLMPGPLPPGPLLPAVERVSACPPIVN